MRTWQYFFLHVYTLGEASEMRGKSETAERDEQESRGSKGEQSLSEPRVDGREQARAKEAARKKRREERKSSGAVSACAAAVLYHMTCDINCA
jgi:hypothetical protein